LVHGIQLPCFFNCIDSFLAPACPVKIPSQPQVGKSITRLYPYCFIDRGNGIVMLSYHHICISKRYIGSAIRFIDQYGLLGHLWTKSRRHSLSPLTQMKPVFFCHLGKRLKIITLCFFSLFWNKRFPDLHQAGQIQRQNRERDQQGNMYNIRGYEGDNSPEYDSHRYPGCT
jgi:hypothetical protein